MELPLSYLLPLPAPWPVTALLPSCTVPPLPRVHQADLENQRQFALLASRDSITYEALDSPADAGRYFARVPDRLTLKKGAQVCLALERRPFPATPPCPHQPLGSTPPAGVCCPLELALRQCINHMTL